MRALCLALALCCVSHAAANITVEGLNRTHLKFTGRDYYYAEEENTLEVETEEFTVSGVTESDVAKGAFYIGSEKWTSEDTLQNRAFTAKASLTVAPEDVASPSKKIYYRVFKEGAEADTIAITYYFYPRVLDLKADTEAYANIVHEGCEVAFDVRGLYSNPLLRTFCGFMEGEKLLVDPTTDTTDEEGKRSFDSNTWTEYDTDSKWKQFEFATDATYKAWKLTDAKLNVKETTEGAALGAKCMIWWDEHEYKEYEGEKVDVKLCGPNPLKDFADKFTDTVEYEAVETTNNCWDEKKKHDTKARMSCTKDGHGYSYYVSCEDGEYKWNEDNAIEWAEECDTAAGILPMSLLVGALALFASSA